MSETVLDIAKCTVVTTQFKEPCIKEQNGERVMVWEPPHRGVFNKCWGISRWYPTAQIQILVCDDGREMAWWRRGEYFVFSCNGMCWYDSQLVHEDVTELKYRQGYDTSCPSDEQLELMVQFICNQSGRHKCQKDQFATPLLIGEHDCVTDSI